MKIKGKNYLNTTWSMDENTECVNLYQTEILRWNSHKIIVSTGGHLTPTTIRRINQMAKAFDLPIFASRKKGELVVTCLSKDFFISNRTPKHAVLERVSEIEWDKAFAETDTQKLQAWLDTVSAEEPLEEMVIENDKIKFVPAIDDDIETANALANASVESLKPVWDTPEEDKAWEYLQENN